MATAHDTVPVRHYGNRVKRSDRSCWAARHAVELATGNRDRVTGPAHPHTKASAIRGVILKGQQQQQQHGRMKRAVLRTASEPSGCEICSSRLRRWKCDFNLRSCLSPVRYCNSTPLPRSSARSMRLSLPLLHPAFFIARCSCPPHTPVPSLPCLPRLLPHLLSPATITFTCG